jgi:NADPH-dependent ferric siderophore reductase
VYVLLPPPGRAELPVGTSFRWTDFYAMAEEDRPVGAYYTVRQFRPEAGELDCDVFLHEPCGNVSGWARRADTGQPAALWGPRAAWHPPEGTTDWLLVADETGLPALCGILERRPDALPVRAFVEVASVAEERALPGGADVTWLHRDGREGGTTELLVDAVRTGGVPTATTYAWGGAESRAMTAIRKHLRHEVGLAKARVSMTPYWRHPRHAEDPIDGDD